MANESVKTINVSLPSLQEDVSIVIPGESRSPTAAMVICSQATQIDTPTNNGAMSFGVTDFITTAVCAHTDEDGQNPTDATSSHIDGKILLMYLPGSNLTILRSATVSPITGGITLSLDQSGSEFLVQVVLFFGAEVAAFSIASPSIVVHNFGVVSNFGIFFSSDEFNISNNHANASIGFMEDNGVLDERAYSFRRANANSFSRTSYGLINDVVATIRDNNGNLAGNFRISSNDVDSVTFSGAPIEATGLIGLLFNLVDVQATTRIIPTPTDISVDWDYIDLPFQPQFGFMVMSLAPTFTATGETPNAGAFGYYAFDQDGRESSTSSRSEHNTQPSRSESNVSNRCRLYSHVGNEVFDFVNPQFTPTGFSVANADIFNLEPAPVQWLGFFIEELNVTGPPVLGLPTDDATGESTSVGVVSTNKQEGVVYGVVTQSPTTPTHAQIVAGQDDLGNPADAFDTVTVLVQAVELSFSGLVASTQYYTHFTQEDASSIPAVTPISADGFTTNEINLPPVVDSPIGNQICKIGVAFGPLDVSGTFSDPNTDPLTFSQTGLPNGLNIDAAGVIGGVPTGGYQP